jgi:hypothetical protein
MPFGKLVPKSGVYSLTTTVEALSAFATGLLGKELLYARHLARPGKHPSEPYAL